jgi:hypothetical protein
MDFTTRIPIFSADFSSWIIVILVSFLTQELASSGCLGIYQSIFSLLILQQGIVLRDWSDPAATGLASVQSGIIDEVREQRGIVFGRNEIDVEGKSTLSLLIDEVACLFPF